MLRPYILRRPRFQRWYIDPAPPRRRRECQLRELHALGALAEIVSERLVRRDVTQKHLPLDLERVVERSLVGNFLPLPVVVDDARHIGVPHRPRRLAAALCLAPPQAGDSTARRAIDLDLPQVVA